ncbi:MAG: hypothetical protein SGJ20_13775 [Planctomycetota bacterium]|nr:hypothetical protein [Planctomycetota bacterium]
MNTTLSNQIRTDVRGAYGSVSSPNWSFCEKRYANHPYGGLIEQLAHVGATQETTDLNDDVSVVVFVDLDGDQGLTIRLSLVGKYACVSNSAGIFLPEQELLDDRRSRKILELVRQEGVSILRPQELSEQFNFGDGLATVYEVLFSADEANG